MIARRDPSTIRARTAELPRSTEALLNLLVHRGPMMTDKAARLMRLTSSSICRHAARLENDRLIISERRQGNTLRAPCAP